MNTSTSAETPASASRYVCLRKIAEGGMAEVLLARREGAAGFRKVVALKRVLPKFADDPVLLDMFLAEARLAATLEHSNLARVMDFGILGGRYFLAMEYVDGRDLRAVMRRVVQTLPQRRLSLSHALYLVQSVAAGLHYAHERRDADGRPLGIVHRDVSPSNVLVSFDGEVKLGDFGIAKATAAPQPGTATANLRGKLAYMSPEQARSEPLDRRSDIFALGIVLFEVTTGFRQFHADTQYELMNRVAEGRVIAPRDVVDDYPEALEAIVLRALAFDRDDRHQTALELYDALGTFAVDHGMRTDAAPQVGALMRSLFPDEEPVPTDHEELETIALGSPVRPTPRPSTELAALPELSEPDRRPVAQPSRRWALVLGAGLMLAVAIAMGRSWGTAPAPQPPQPAASSDRARDRADATDDTVPPRPPPPAPVASEPVASDEPPAAPIDTAPTQPDPTADPAPAASDGAQPPAPAPRPKRGRKKRARKKSDPGRRGGRLEDWTLPPAH